jgi:hypothetical protein
MRARGADEAQLRLFWAFSASGRSSVRLGGKESASGVQEGLMFALL